MHEICVTNAGSGTVSVISDSSNSVVVTIDLNTSHGGQYIIYDSGKGEMFVNNYASGIVSVISDSTNQVVATIPLGTNPDPVGLIYDSGKGEVFVAYESLPSDKPANFMSVISDSKNSVIATVPLGSNIASSLGAYDPATRELYMPDPNNDSVLVISDRTNSIVDSIPVGMIPIGVGYDPLKGVLFVSDGVTATRIVSDKTNSIIETVPILSVVMVYDSGRSEMLDLGNGAIQFVSDSSLPSESSTPAVPELPWLAVIPLFVAMLSVSVILRHRKTANLKQ